jgi:signal transduction protein with GAF and PtsI domain
MGTDVVKNITLSCTKLGEVELSGVKLENAAGKLLDVQSDSLDRHVAMQPAAIAYYGSLKKEAGRRLAALERAYDKWQRKKYAEAKVAVESGTANKNTIKVEDVKARFIVDNEVEIQKWEDQIEKAQFEFDTLDVWYEAWRQKSFSIREMASIEEDERFNGNPSIDGRGERKTESEVKIERVREIMNRRKAASQSAGQSLSGNRPISQ